MRNLDVNGEYYGRFNMRTDATGERHVSDARKPGGTRKPRTATRALTDCKCYIETEHGRQLTRVIERRAANAPKSRKSRTRTISAPVRNDYALMSRMGSVHDGDN